MKNKALAIDIGNTIYRDGANRPQRQDIPESDKTPQWFFRNAIYFLTFYNQPTGRLKFDSAVSDRSTSTVPGDERVYPVQHMIRMMMYYLGKQPNLDFAYLTQNVGNNNMQAQWYKGQDVAEFVNFFRGLMLSRLSKANWTAKSVSRETQNRYTEMYDKLEISILLAPLFKDMEEKYGIGFRPMPGVEIDVPEDIERAMETNFHEESSIVASDLANGIWFTNNWMQKSLKSFMHTTIAGCTGWWHRVENGRNIEEIIQPYQLIEDNRYDDDYGAYDEFRGVVESLNAYEITQSRFADCFDDAQIKDIYEMVADESKTALYNAGTTNIYWWGRPNGVNDNTATAVTIYWRTRREVLKVKARNRFGNDTIRKKQSEDEPGTYYVNDIAYATIIGNRYLAKWGYVDNLVESVEDPSRPEFPIFRFRPNTFLSNSVSEVGRIHRIQDEMDMYDFKIREMVGRAKGKTYIVHGDKLGEATSVQELVDDLSDMGIHVSVGTSGEDGDPSDRKSSVEYIDLTLDPNIHRLAELYRERKERMGRVVSTSNISLGQQTRYIGYGQQQSSIAQNQMGISYLIDGFLDFLVLNMRFAINRAKYLYAGGDDVGAEYLIGEKGVRFIKFTRDMRFERLMTALNINDSIDEAGRQRMLSYAQAWSQNPVFGVSPSSIIKMEAAKSYTEAANILDFDMKKSKKEKSQQEAAMQEAQSQLSQSAQMFQAAIAQLKEDNANYRAELQALVKGYSQMEKSLSEPPPSPLQPQISMQTQQVMAQIEQAAQQQQQQQQGAGFSPEQQQ